MLVTLIYKSRLQDSLGWSEIVKISSHAKEKNEGLGITGMLIMNGCDVLQVLEGEPEPVNGLYRQIMVDERHYDVQLVSYGVLSKRYFGRWKMKEVNLQRMEAPHRDVITGLLDHDEAGGDVFPVTFERAYALLAFVNAITSER